jgi:hypothetical protein
MMLLLSGVLVTANAQPLKVTLLSLDTVATSVVATGDEVTFTGTLALADGSGVGNVTVNIIEERDAKLTVLTTAETDGNGAFITTWIADVADTAQDRIMSVFAAFDGISGYGASKSGKQTIKVAIQDMQVSFTFDKPVYISGEVATFTLQFSSPRGFPIDPENMRGIYDGVTVSLDRKSEGVYLYKTPPLTPPTHTLQVIAEKHGYKLFNDATTVSVFVHQAAPGVLLNFDWMPVEVVEGIPVSLKLGFTDANRIVTPYVTYDFSISQGSEVIVDLQGEQTTDGTAEYEHTFDGGGQYKVTVNIKGIGQGDSFRPITQSYDFDIDVFRSIALEVRAKAMQKGDAMRLDLRNSPLTAAPRIFSVELTFDGASDAKIRAPSGWDVSVEGDTVTVETSASPMETGKILRLRMLVEGTVDSIRWSAMDQAGDEQSSGNAIVRQFRT